MNQNVMIKKRDGSLNLGDTPLYFRNKVEIDGEVFWQIKWLPTRIYGNAEVSYLLFDSFENETTLK